MNLKIKSITRSNWPRVPRSTFTWMEVGRGIAALIRLDEVTAPLIKCVQGKDITLVDTHYHWLQLAFPQKHWWLTAMLDECGHILQYYFDVTLENQIDGRHSAFVDLFLDVVALPNGQCELLDQDELEQAFQEGQITEEQFSLAQTTAQELMQKIPSSIHQINAYCGVLFSALCDKMTAVEH